MQHDLTNLQKKNERRLPAVAKSFLYESKRNFWSYTMKFQIRHTVIRVQINLVQHTKPSHTTTMTQRQETLIADPQLQPQS